MFLRTSNLIVAVFLFAQSICPTLQLADMFDCMANFNLEDDTSISHVHSTMSDEDQAKAIVSIKTAFSSCLSNQERNKKCDIESLMAKNWDKEKWTATFSVGPYVHYWTLPSDVRANEHFMAYCSVHDDYYVTVIIAESQKSRLTTSTATSATSPQPVMTDCYDWLHSGGKTASGVYRLSPPGIAPFDAYCDMTTDGGGWTVFQSRINNKLVFWNRTWNEYKAGFGNVGARQNFWLGLDKINALSAKDANVRLRIDITGNRCLYCTPPNCLKECGNDYSWFGEWKYFLVENEANKYRLLVSPVIGGNLSSVAFAGHGELRFNNEQYFSTFDQDNDMHQNENGKDENCAQLPAQFGAWWHASCSFYNLNGNYDAEKGKMGFSIRSNFNNNNDYPVINPTTSAMKLRCNR